MFFIKSSTKILANKLEKILPVIISLNQSTFILRRLSSNDIILAYETMHSMNSRLSGKYGYMTVKLDISKAYDRVELVFLRDLMLKIGFDQRWFELVMKCVASVTYYILINGVP